MYKIVWSHYFPDYAERMAWMNLSIVVQYAKNEADKLTLIPKE